MLGDRTFEALRHSERRRILELLQQKGELAAGELAEYFDFSKPTLSHHLKLLVDAGLLDKERRGQFIYYRINMSVAEEVVHAIANMLAPKRRRRPA
ncbi:MAG: metalloregulator ArsR/SmtB family transcription factor [Myxococcales bacterium]|nr:metalloregulator ArsR/SmtB family transcription factor [Myxococcales bacterium]